MLTFKVCKAKIIIFSKFTNSFILILYTYYTFEVKKIKEFKNTFKLRLITHHSIKLVLIKRQDKLYFKKGFKTRQSLKLGKKFD